MKLSLEAAKFAYQDYKRRKKYSFRSRRGRVKTFLKVSGIIVFIVLVTWLVYDFVRFAFE